MPNLTFVAGFRFCVGSPSKTNTLQIKRDSDGNLILSVEEVGGDMGNMKSGGVRVETARGDPSQHKVFDAMLELVKAIEDSAKEYPSSPCFIVPTPPEDAYHEKNDDLIRLSNAARYKY